MKRKIVLGAMALALTVSHICAQTPPPQSKSAGAPELAVLLEKSGYRYTKIRDGVWEITFAGKNTGQFPVRIALTDNTVVVLAKLADRAELKLQVPFLVKMLELNDKFDSVKLALSDEMLYVRMDMHARILDPGELKYLLEQISGATDEMYPMLKEFLPTPK
jgi:predicted TIM-barrel enzyme